MFIIQCKEFHLSPHHSSTCGEVSLNRCKKIKMRIMITIMAIFIILTTLPCPNVFIIQCKECYRHPHHPRSRSGQWSLNGCKDVSLNPLILTCCHQRQFQNCRQDQDPDQHHGHLYHLDRLKHQHLHALLIHPLSLSPQASFATSLHTPRQSHFHLLPLLDLPKPSLPSYLLTFLPSPKGSNFH